MNESVLKNFPTQYLKWKAMRGQGVLMLHGWLDAAMSGQCTYRSQSWKAVEWTDKPGTWVDVTLREEGTDELLLVTTSATDSGVRYLPWEENTVTYRAVDAAAKYFFTGPLNGCNVYCGYNAAGTLYAYHANRNNVPDPHENAEVKLGMMRTVLLTKTPGVTIRHQLRSSMYQGQAFVIGVKGWFGWRFYAHSLTLNGTKTVIEFAAKQI